jgi:hypothetical protein
MKNSIIFTFAVCLSLAVVASTEDLDAHKKWAEDIISKQIINGQIYYISHITL